jgi:phage terminase large subunit
MIDLFDHQDSFLYSDAVHTGLVAGFGSGKTFIGTVKTVRKKLLYPNINVAYYLPTYGLIKDIAFPRFAEILDLQNIPYELNKSDKEFITPYGKIIMRSMDNPDLIIGYEVGYSLIDEADILPTNKMQEVFIKALARNRSKLPNNERNSLDFVSTPEGFKFLYNFFVKNKKPNRILIKGKTSDNTELPEGYIETLLESYTPEQVEAYLNGEFINLTSGIVYRNFDMSYNHSERCIKDGDVLHVGMDFNITNMNAVVHVIDSKPIAVAEISGVFDTQAMCDELKNRYPNHSIVIYPDASGQNRSTSGKSDIQILRNAKFTIRSLNKNPFVRDRVNAMNNAFLNNKGVRNYLINTNNCPIYTDALQQQTYNNGAPDKQGGFDHICEAGGYFIWQQNNNRRFVSARA